MNMNYMQYQNPMQRPNYYQQQQPMGFGANRIRPVSSFEEVKAASIDFDGSVFYFPDLANKKIYTKHIGMDGAAVFNMYELKEIPVAAAQPTTIDTSQFVTREEFEKVIRQIAVPAQVSTEPDQGTQTQSGKPSFEF